MTKGVFISLEGIEGAGKTTVLNAIQAKLKIPGRKITFTREPGGTEIAERIRQLLTAHENKGMQPLTELLLMYAARNEHISTTIQPALKQGDIVITDRYVDASYAYQCAGRHLPEAILKTLDEWIVKTCMPNLTILLTAPVDMCLERVYQRGNQDRFDAESASFFVATQLGYQKRAAADTGRVHVIDATANPEAVAATAISLITTCVQAIGT